MILGYYHDREVKCSYRLQIKVATYCKHIHSSNNGLMMRFKSRKHDVATSLRNRDRSWSLRNNKTAHK